MDVDRPVIAGIAQHADDPLRLAQRIGADKMRAFRKLFDGFYQLGDFVPGIGMPEHRQGEGRLGYEHVAGNGFKPDAGGIRRPLVVTRTDDAHAILLDGNLCRSQNVTRRVKADLDAIDVADGSELCRLGRSGKIVAIAYPHDVECLLRRHDMLVAGSGVVGMAMGDQGALHRADGIDMKIPRRGIETRWR